jgi:aerobic carbon-monoxide dehydrogenase medium subunit
VKPAAFDYYDPEQLHEALDLLAGLAEDAKVLAGGQSLIPLMNMRLARPEHLIDLRRVPGLDDIRVTDTALQIGAMVRHRVVERSATVRAVNPLLAKAASHIAHFQIRERGTLGGSIAHGDPAAEMPLLATVLGATIHAASTRGVRTISADDFFESVFMTALEPDEIVIRVDMPHLTPGQGWAVDEVARRHGDFAVVAAAATVTMREGRYAEARVGLAGVGATPVLSTHADLIVGEVPSDELWEMVARRTAAETSPASDIHASADDRRDLAALLVRQCLAEATRRAQPEGSQR